MITLSLESKQNLKFSRQETEQLHLDIVCQISKVYAIEKEKYISIDESRILMWYSNSILIKLIQGVRDYSKSKVEDRLRLRLKKKMEIIVHIQESDMEAREQEPETRLERVTKWITRLLKLDHLLVLEPLPLFLGRQVCCFIFVVFERVASEIFLSVGSVNLWAYESNVISWWLKNLVVSTDPLDSDCVLNIFDHHFRDVFFCRRSSNKSLPLYIVACWEKKMIINCPFDDWISHWLIRLCSWYSAR